MEKEKKALFLLLYKTKRLILVNILIFGSEKVLLIVFLTLMAATSPKEYSEQQENGLKKA
ncbi:hypothetical protein [Flavobacterium sp. U410]|jgi:hypothetical protein